MASKKITIDIEINGKMRKATVSAKKLANALQQTEEHARTTDRRLKGASQQSANATKNFSKMAQGISGGLVPAYATLAAQVFAVTAVFSFLKQAADFRVIRESQIAFSSATGVGMRTLTSDLQAASGAMLTFKEAATGASFGVASGLSAMQITDFAEGAKNLSLILGRDVTDSFNRLIRGVAKAEPELLDELGITLRLEDAQQRYATSLGKTANQLSNFEKKQAIAVNVQQQLDEKINSAAEGAEVQANAIAKLGVAFDSLLKPINSFISAVAEPTAEFFTKNIESLAAALTLMAIPIVKSIIPSLDDFAAGSAEAAAVASKEIEKVKNEIAELDVAAQKLKKSGESPIGAAQAALSGVKSKGKGITAIQAGQRPDDRTIKALLRAAEKDQGAVKKMTRTMKAQYKAALREMLNDTKTTTTKITNQVQKIGNAWDRTSKRTELVWKQAMSRVSAAGAMAARGLNLAFRAAGIIGILTLIIDLGKEAGKILGIISEDLAARDLQGRMEAQIQALKDASDQYKNLAKNQKELLNLTEQDTRFANRGLTAATVFGNFAEMQAKQILTTYNLLKEKLPAIKEDMLEILDTDTAAQKNRKKRLNYMKSRQNDTGRRLGSEGEVNKQQLREQLKGLTSQFLLVAEASNQNTAPLKAFFDALNSGNDVTEEQIQEFERLVGTYTNTGAQAKFLAEQQNQINSQFTKAKNSLTQFRTSVTGVIDLIQDQIANEEKLKLDGYQERVRLLTEQLSLMEKIRELEVQQIIRNAEIERSTAQFRMRQGGMVATSGMMDERRRAAAYETANSNVIQATAALDLAMGDEKSDPKKIELLSIQLDTAKAKAEAMYSEMLEGTRLLSGAAQAFETSMTSAIEGIITGTMSLKDAFKSVATSILGALAKMISQMIVFRIMSSMFPGMTQTPSYSMMEMVPKGRYGGIMSDGKKAPGYAVGGVAKGPQSGYPAILHGTEAVVPLPNGKSIPVDMKGAGQNNVTVNVSIDNQGNAQQSAQADSTQGANLGSVIAAAVQKELQNQKRSGGILNRHGAA